jgi:hypothetical protein
VQCPQVEAEHYTHARRSYKPKQPTLLQNLVIVTNNSELQMLADTTGICGYQAQKSLYSRGPSQRAVFRQFGFKPDTTPDIPVSLLWGDKRQLGMVGRLAKHQRGSTLLSIFCQLPVTDVITVRHRSHHHVHNGNHVTGIESSFSNCAPDTRRAEVTRNPRRPKGVHTSCKSSHVYGRYRAECVEHNANLCYACRYQVSRSH